MGDSYRISMHPVVEEERELNQMHRSHFLIHFAFCFRRTRICSVVVQTSSSLTRLDECRSEERVVRGNPHVGGTRQSARSGVRNILVFRNGSQRTISELADGRTLLWQNGSV